MSKKAVLILVSGFPATGKTTLSEMIASKFNLPLIANDRLKEIVYDSVGNWDDQEFSKKLGKSVYDLMYHVSKEILSSGQSCVLEAFFLEKFATPRIKKLKEETDCALFQICLKCDWEIAKKRYDEREKISDRHLCHFGKVDFKNLSGDVSEARIDMDGETIEIDTTDFNKVDYEEIMDKVGKKLRISLTQ